MEKYNVLILEDLIAERGFNSEFTAEDAFEFLTAVIENHIRKDRMFSAKKLTVAS